MKPANITTILLVIIVGLSVWMIRGCLTPTPPNEKVIRNELKLEMLEKALPGFIRERDSIRIKYDSLLTASELRYQELENKKQPIRNAIKADRVTVDNFDKEQLRRAITSHE